jgi:hypothetical protein
MQTLNVFAFRRLHHCLSGCTSQFILRISAESAKLSNRIN